MGGMRQTRSLVARKREREKEREREGGKERERGRKKIQEERQTDRKLE